MQKAEKNWLMLILNNSYQLKNGNFMTNITDEEAQYLQECCDKVEPNKIFFWYSLIAITSFSLTLLINFLIN